MPWLVKCLLGSRRPVLGPLAHPPSLRKHRLSSLVCACRPSAGENLLQTSPPHKEADASELRQDTEGGTVAGREGTLGNR